MRQQERAKSLDRDALQKFPEACRAFVTFGGDLHARVTEFQFITKSKRNVRAVNRYNKERERRRAQTEKLKKFRQQHEESMAARLKDAVMRKIMRKGVQ